MLAEDDDIRTPWGWLRGFAWFLMAWPVLSLLAADRFDWSEWDMVLLAMLGPAALGVVLFGVERLLTKTLGHVASRRQPVPSILRDISNTALTLAILLGIDVALVGIFEDESLFAREDLEAGPIAAVLLAWAFGTAVLFRLAHRIRRGPGRLEDMGEHWGSAPTVTRFIGYATMIPLLLVCTVMLDYAMRGDDSEFGPTAWVVLPLCLWLAQRSAMARSPRYWARNPWEAWMRAESLALPWWIISAAIGLGCAVAFVVLPFAAAEDEISMAGRVIVGVLLGPIGLLTLWLGARMIGRYIRMTPRRWSVATTLRRKPSALASWSVASSEATAAASPGAQGHAAQTTDVIVTVDGGRSARFSVEGPDAPMIRWLRENHPRG